MTEEPLDRNKTDLTHRLTALAMIYLENRGFRPVETEVPIAGFGIVDLGGFVTPTPTEVMKLRLNIQRKFGLAGERYDEVMFHYGPILTAVVEIKVTRADFKKDIERKFNSNWPAHLCYLAYPKDLLAESELPSGWLGLESDSNGGTLRRRHWNRPVVHPQHPGIVAEFLAALAVRTDKRTRFARWRYMLKMHRAGNM